jgi:hypothetical protein
MLIAEIEYPLTDIIEQERMEHVWLNLERGNHLVKDKKAEEKLNNFAKNEMGFGYLIPIPKSRVVTIPGTKVYSIHIVR